MALALETEALLLRGGASSLLTGEEKEEEEERPGGRTGGATPGDSPEEEHGQRRREWDEELGRSRRRLSPQVDEARYCSLTRQLCEAQRRADVAVLLQSRAASCDPALRW